MKLLTAIPVYNEERHVEAVLREVKRYSDRILVVNDGSTDRTGELLASDPELCIVTHEKNRGYGAALVSAFRAALASECEVLITMDCDGQHEPARIPVLLEAIHDADIVSGSRYLRDFRQDTLPTPADRRFINLTITRELNERFGLHLTDAFCGFKAYRIDALAKLRITETGWGMPLQLGASRKLGLHQGSRRAATLSRSNRAFGGMLNDANNGLHYRPRHRGSRVGTGERSVAV